MSVRILAVPYDDQRVQRLVDVVQQEYVERYGGPDESAVDVGEVAPPRGRFFVALRDGQPVGMGGWRLRSDVRDLGARRAAEIKRMYVAPAERRGGLARLILRTLEDSAREAGCDVLVLETGLRQPEAIALYESAGYVRVADFGHYKDAPLSRCYGRRLAD
jgi:GNAT superfamily N-acetyltransferase